MIISREIVIYIPKSEAGHEGGAERRVSESEEGRGRGRGRGCGFGDSIYSLGCLFGRYFGWLLGVIYIGIVIKVQIFICIYCEVG